MSKKTYTIKEEDLNGLINLVSRTIVHAQAHPIIEQMVKGDIFKEVVEQPINVKEDIKTAQEESQTVEAQLFPNSE